MDTIDLADIYALMRKAIADAGGQSAWAARVGVSPQYVSDVVNGRRDPAARMLAAVGVKRVTVYRRVLP